MFAVIYHYAEFQLFTAMTKMHKILNGALVECD